MEVGEPLALSVGTSLRCRLPNILPDSRQQLPDHQPLGVIVVLMDAWPLSATLSLSNT